MQVAVGEAWKSWEPIISQGLNGMQGRYVRPAGRIPKKTGGHHAGRDGGGNDQRWMGKSGDEEKLATSERAGKAGEDDPGLSRAWESDPPLSYLFPFPASRSNACTGLDRQRTPNQSAQMSRIPLPQWYGSTPATTHPILTLRH